MPTAVPAVRIRGPGTRAGVDRVAQGDLEVAQRARAPGRRHAGPEGHGGVTGGGQHDLRVRAPEDDPDRSLGRIEGVVRVGVDQPGQEGLAGAVDAGDRRSGGISGVAIGPGRVVWLDRRDPVAVDEHVDVLPGGVGHAIDQSDVGDEGAHR